MPFQFLNSKGKPVEPPQLAVGARIADTHCHLNMLSDKASAIAHAAACGVSLLVNMTDPVEDAAEAYAHIGSWMEQAQSLLDACAREGSLPKGISVPEYRMAVGVHPHNAKDFTPEVEELLERCLEDPRTVALGEVGLDYHYDLSPRDVQRDVFARQLEIARKREMPVVLHLREAHADALPILREAGLASGRVLVHCWNLAYAEFAPFARTGCLAAIGGPVTFGKGDDARESAALMPQDRLVTETDSPYMAPAPLRGTECTPAHTVFSTAKICEVRGLEAPDARQGEFLDTLYANACAFFGI